MRVLTKAGAMFGTVLLAVLAAGCGGGGPDASRSASGSANASGQAGPSHPSEVPGIPAAPTGKALSDLEAALHRIDPQAFTNEGDTIGKAIDQCHDLNTGTADPVGSAQRRFSNGSSQITAQQAQPINDVLKQKLC